MIKHLSVVAAAVLIETVVCAANVSARGFGSGHGGGSGGRSVGGHPANYGGNHYGGGHEGSYDGNYHSGGYAGGNRGGVYGHEGGYYGAGGAAYGAAAYGAAANSGYYSAIPSDEGLSQVAPQTDGDATNGPVIISGYPAAPGAVGAWGGNAAGFRGPAGLSDGEGARRDADAFRGGGGFRGGVR